MDEDKNICQLIFLAKEIKLTKTQKIIQMKYLRKYLKIIQLINYTLHIY